MSKASKTTKEFYQEGADGFLAAAARRAGANPNSVAPNEHLRLLKQHLMADNSKLKPGTVAVYRQQIAVAIANLLERGADAQQAQETKEALLMRISERCGEPAQARGSSLKVEVPELLELSDIFYKLKTRFLEHADIQDLILSLYLLCVPRLGMRPIELTWARRNGSSLEVATAKRSGRPHRDIPLAEWPPEYIFALDILLALLPRNLSDAEFRKWRNALASRLARASMHSRKERRLALYCCRHIAFANWRDIGMSPDEIRRLAGHVALKSQSHYAKGKSGFGKNFMFLANDSSLTSDSGQNKHADAEAELIKERVDPSPRLDLGSPVTAETPDRPAKIVTSQTSETGGIFIVEAMPQPAPKNINTRPDIDARAHFKQLADDVEQAVNSYKETIRNEPSPQRHPGKTKKR